MTNWNKFVKNFYKVSKIFLSVTQFSPHLKDIKTAGSTGLFDGCKV